MKNEFMTASLDPGKVSDLLRECARKHVLPWRGKLLAEHKTFKEGNPHNEVTVADRESEEFLTRTLTALLPGSVVVGEEATENDPRIPELLKDPAKTVWVIDPIDGTSNFISGSDNFCIMVALVEGGEVRMSWIYDAVNDSMAFAEKGMGAFLDGKRLQVDSGARLDTGRGYAGYKIMSNVSNITTKTLRCAGHEYLHVARGDAAFALYGYIKPWDHFAGAFMVEEAGGYVRKWDGTPYRPGDTKGGVIAAASARLWQEIRDLIPHQFLQRHGIEP